MTYKYSLKDGTLEKGWKDKDEKRYMNAVKNEITTFRVVIYIVIFASLLLFGLAIGVMELIALWKYINA